MKRLLVLPLSLLSFIAVGLVPRTADAAQKTYYAPLGGANEVPPVYTNGTGSTQLTFDDQTKELSGTVTYAGLSGPPTAGHIHQGACGEIGDPIYTFADISKSPVDVKVTLDSAQEQALVAGNLYINFHTGTYPNGEIRGQLFPTLKACPAVDGGTSTDAGAKADGGGGPTTTPTPGGGNVKDPDAGTASPTSSGGENDGGCAMASRDGASNAGAGLAALGTAVIGLALVRRRRKGRTERCEES